ncbi:MAG: Nif3-like dinuclear metal center hexameric protein [Methanoregula sp.]|nr:Nif3-like dinuclear metal center hexameric protein [Methanoregula sp.]
MHVRAFMEEMEQLAPPDLAEEFDAGRIGLVVEGRNNVGTVCCALDATPAVVESAVRAGAGMLVVHHTPLWTPVTAMTGSTASLMRSILSAHMNLYVMHTNYDHAPEGTNDALCELLALTNTVPMTLGCVGDCPLDTGEIARRLACPVRVWGRIGNIKRLAVVAGSGFDPALLDEAEQLDASAFLSSEMKHSVARGARIPCIEATHYALEAPAMKRLAGRKGWIYVDDPPLVRSVP